ncbi:MAG: hypothetical protein MUC65_00105, partial [Pontiellaceae bacterium]|nr:hypothetical protein [Pontiellaceae bacterium]
NNTQRKRWIDVCLMALFGGLLISGIVFLDGWIGSSLRPPFWALFVWFVLTFFVWIVLAIFSGWALSLKRILNYPPTAFAIILGYALYLGLTSWHWAGFIAGLLTQSVCWYIGKFFVASYHRISKAQQKEVASDSSVSDELWFMDDSPVIDANNDHFKIRGTENQIVQLVAKQNKNVAVLGKYGSGKSTVIKWATQELKSKYPEYVICTLGAWGRRREGFSSHLLKMGTAKLKPHMDVLSFIDLPMQYHAALSSHGFWGELFAAAFSSRNSIEVLVRLNEALGCEGKKLLFVIEDVDRNQDKDILKEELPSLLDRINGLNRINSASNISFILAVDAESVDAAWPLRVASCVDMPVIEALQALREIETFRKLLFKEKWIDPVSPEKRGKWFSSENSDPYSIPQKYLDASFTTQHALINFFGQSSRI